VRKSVDLERTLHALVGLRQRPELAREVAAVNVLSIITGGAKWLEIKISAAARPFYDCAS
jgi:hypothetical protein